MVNTIFTYCNHQIHPDISKYQHLVINQLIKNTDIDFNPLMYNLNDGDIYPDDIIHYGINELFKIGYENILILDIDCIPLSLEALNYTFNRASEKVLIGNAQRSHHLDNNKHIFIGSSCLCLNRDLYTDMGTPSFAPNKRGDIAESLTYICEERNFPLEIFEPQSFETSPYGIEMWELDGVMNPYGIGTIFQRHDKFPMFYHLFESRHNLHIDRFVNKCKSILNFDVF